MILRTPSRSIAALLTLAAFAACSDSEQSDPEIIAPQFSKAAMSETDAALFGMMDEINATLAESGAAYRVAMAEHLGMDAMGSTVLAKDVGNKQLSADFVAGDERRAWSGAAVGSPDDLTYALDRTGDAAPVFGGVSGAASNAAIDRAMATWSAVQCTDLAILPAPDFGFDIGVVQFANGLGGSPFVFADVQHAGYGINFAGSVLGVTFTYLFLDADGNFSDIDRDGRLDVAFREIYYDPSWSWADDGSTNIDIESVALHEAGHGLSRAHFGTVRIKNDGSIKASPRAVMNALYGGPLRDLVGPDIGGHCSDWGSWPNRRTRM